MELFYHNPLLGVSTASNYIGTNPLEGFSINPDHMSPALLNPSLYDPYIFSQFPALTLYYTTVLASSLVATSFSNSPVIATDLGGYEEFPYSYDTTQYYQTIATFSTQFSAIETNSASYQMLYPTLFSQRFGTELQTVSNVEYTVTDVLGSYEMTYSSNYIYYSNVTVTYSRNTNLLWIKVSSSTSSPFSYLGSTGLLDTYTINEAITTASTFQYDAGSSMFVEMMGSNVFTGLLITTNSVIISDNESINSYYSESLSYQINVANLTAALNSVSTTTGNNELGSGTITATNFWWSWFTTTQGWAGVQRTDFDSYLFTVVVNSYLYYTYDGTVITGSSTAVTQVQSLITIENNNLSNAQAFLDDSVTTLQSDISLASEIIGSLASTMQTLINYM